MNAYCTIDQIALELNVAVTAQNTAKLTACAEAVALHIDHAIDSPDAPDYTEPWNPIMNRVNAVAGAEWFKANDAMFGVYGYDQTGQLRTPRDGFARYRAMLLPLKQRFGVA